MGNRVQAVLLDMDGTLFDSEAFYKRLWQDTARDFGIDLNDRVYKQFLGAPYSVCKQLIKDLGGESFSLDDFLQAMSKQESGHIPALKPGAEELLIWLKQLNIPLALVTSAEHIKIHKNFAPHPQLQVFDVIVAFEDVDQAKPHPEPYLLACKKLGVSPENALAVEDSNAGALSALEAGCQTLMVPDVLAVDGQIQSQLAAVLDSLHALPNWLRDRL
ncbi:HAD family hydrolase [Parendozoicomonas haliclonae]|uniref:Phosphorylated carbohydrates phosphatase n=1 Tax=Parendozoicomonas haliclonae TaxID=1960125 RepID=A0A1X7AFU7_9GAMM|nr:HAD family phosphatase [Parendozoicomonas haliclonae]SMA38562.1 Phosphorylated carbohydrates phosphatase [Parendozoicomonas haliclonae]